MAITEHAVHGSFVEEHSSELEKLDCDATGKTLNGMNHLLPFQILQSQFLLIAQLRYVDRKERSQGQRSHSETLGTFETAEAYFPSRRAPEGMAQSAKDK